MAARKTPLKSVDGGASRVIDLDEARAARAEKRADAEPPAIRFAGKDWPLPPELPSDFVLEIEEGRLREALHSLFGDTSDAEKFFSEELSIDDLQVLVEGVNEVYGVDKGK